MFKQNIISTYNIHNTFGYVEKSKDTYAKPMNEN